MAQPYTRVTLMGRHRHIDLLLPSTAPVGSLMPQILDLLGDRPDERIGTKVLLAADGRSLAADESLAGAGVLDGTSLTLANHYDAPPPAVAYDISDTVLEESAKPAGRWNHAQLVAASGIFAVLALWLGLELVFGSLADDRRWWAYPVIGGVLLALGSSIASVSRPVATTALAGGWGTVLLGLLHTDAGTGPRLLIAAAATTVFIATLATVSARPRSLLLAAAVTGALSAIWSGAVPFAAWAASTPETGSLAAVGGLGAIASVLVMGLLPSMALSVSGLATLDDQRANGAVIWRRDALGALHSAHAGLTLSTVAAALSAATGMWLLATDTAAPKWSLPLLLALVLATLLRSSAFPMAIERHSLHLACAVGTTGGVLALARLNPDLRLLVGAGVLVLALLIGLGLAVRLPAHTGARIRQIAERVETVAVLATVPLIAGYFGVYSQMLATF